ncbi:hypothetical protein [Bradyrhizobium canariense]|uniref:Uncharacterized protein n=1 Tax=Bradyrhizobium canariense TaxID=255045 RepID=A0A1H2BMI8_9BRAD|nr:hypothetical protein [Bradyrhizobium canariense]SDT59433.1 hypothetical protein SAMN05444158_7344 [Bradyrhizobium canariense]
MVMIALCSSLIGAVLGTRFRVQVLFTAAMLGFVTVAAIAAVKSSSLLSVIAAEFVYAMSLQIGYLAGLFAQACMMAARLPSHRSLSSTTVRS